MLVHMRIPSNLFIESQKRSGHFVPSDANCALAAHPTQPTQERQSEPAPDIVRRLCVTRRGTISLRKRSKLATIRAILKAVTRETLGAARREGMSLNV